MGEKDTKGSTVQLKSIAASPLGPQSLDIADDSCGDVVDGNGRLLENHKALLAAMGVMEAAEYAFRHDT